MKIRFISSVIILLLSLPVYALAHYPWINLQKYNLAADKEAKLTIGWGHTFPYEGFMNPDRLDEIFIFGADNAKISLNVENTLEFVSASSLKTGSYVVGAKSKSGYHTRTTQGSKRQSKEGLDGVISCSYSSNSMKSVLNVGQAAEKVDQVVGHPLEIIPLANPAALKVGDYLPIRVLLEGKPYEGYFYATYAGFSTRAEVFAYAAETDGGGQGELRILHPGTWLIKVEHKESYPDLNVCDTRVYRAALTFQID